MTKQEMMVEAHKIAKEELEGDYQARLSLALRQLWKIKKEEYKMSEDKVIIEQNKKECYIKVDGEIVCTDPYVVSNMGMTRDGFERSERVENPKPWLNIFEVTKKRFEEVASQFEEIEMYQEALKKARETGEKAKYYAYTEKCNNPKEQCDIDKIFLYVTPEGKIDEERIHTC